MIRPNRVLTGLILSGALALSTWGAATAVKAATPAAAALPPDIARLFDQLVGEWSAGDLRLEAGGQVMKGKSQVECHKTAGGLAVQCRVRFSAPGLEIDDVNVFGWDGDAGEVHLFCAGNAGPAHDHRGRFDGATLAVENREQRGGKPALDRVVFTFKGPRELHWKTSMTRDGKTLFAGEGVYRR